MMDRIGALALALALAPAGAMVYFSADCPGQDAGTGQCIYSIDASTPTANASYSLVFSGVGKISALEVDTAGNVVYWTDRTNEDLWVAELGGNFTDATVVQSGMGEPHDIAIRASTGAIYWTDKNDACVYVSYDGGADRAIFASGLNAPVGIEVDDNNNLLYVGDYGAGKIYTYSLSSDGEEDMLGEAKASTFVHNASMPRSMLLNDGMLYWIELGADTDDPDDVSSGFVYRASTGTVDASDDKELFFSGLVDPDCLAELDGALLVSDEDSMKVTYASLSTDDDALPIERTILAMGPSPRALTAYTEDDALLPARLAAKRASTQQQQAAQEVTSVMSTRWLAVGSGVLVVNMALVIVGLRRRAARATYEAVV
jgi:hypothetical protein